MTDFIDTQLNQRPDQYGLPTAAQAPGKPNPKAIFDQYGKPYTKPEPREVAPATLGGWRYYKSNTIADELTPRRLVDLLHQAEQTGEIRYLMELFEAMEQRDAKLAGLCGQRKSGVTGCQFALDPGDDSAAAGKARDLVQSLMPSPDGKQLGRIQSWSDRVKDLLDAVMKGFSCLEIIWETSEKQWLPSDLKFRPQRWWREDLIDRTKLLLLDTSAPLGMAVNPFNFIIHQHHAASGAIHRGGVLNACTRPFLVRSWGLNDWLELAEICGIPVRLGELPMGATKDDADLMWRALMSLGSAAAGMVPAGGKITFAENVRLANNGEIFDKLRERAGGEMELMIVGQMETSGSSAGGGRGLGHSGKPQENVRFDLIDSDAKALDETINRQFCAPITLLNFGPGVAAPVYRTLVEEAEDLDKLSQVVTRLVSVGQPVSQSWVAKKFGIPEPDEGDELLEPPVQGSPGSTPSGIENSMRANSAAARTVKKKFHTRPKAQPVRSEDFVT